VLNTSGWQTLNFISVPDDAHRTCHPTEFTASVNNPHHLPVFTKESLILHHTMLK